MKKIIWIISLSILFTSCESQNLKHELKQIKELPYAEGLSGDSLYWSIVVKGIDLVPDLIDEISDTTMTKAPVANFGGYFSTGDISYRIICEIILDIPTRDLMKNKDDSNGGYWYYWKFVREKTENRELFEQNVREWFNDNKDSLKWVNDTKDYRIPKKWFTNSKKHPAGGYYELR